MDSVTVSIEIARPPEVVYDAVADLTRMGEWSPEARAASWRGGATGPAVGARFRGHNRVGWRRWSTDGVVLVADRGSEFTFDINVGPLPIARWRYEFAPLADGRTRVVESWTDRRRGPVGVLFRTFGGVATGANDRRRRNEETMRVTLQRLKDVLESSA